MQNKQIRITNLRQLIKREGAVSQLALRLQISPIYIYRVLDGKFNIGDSMARKIEDAYGFPLGWMDSAQGATTVSEPVPTLSPAQRVTPDYEYPSERASDMGQPQHTQPPPQPPTPPRPSTPPPPVADSPPQTNQLPQDPASEHDVTSSSDRGAGSTSDDVSDRMISGIINTLERMLVANGLDLTDMEKARLLMKVAEKILDGQGGAASRDEANKPVLKIS